MRRHSAIWYLLCACLMVLPSIKVRADDLSYDIRGVPEPMLSNVRSHVDAFRLGGNLGSTPDRLEKLVEDAEERVRAALRPYGYYKPSIKSELGTADADAATLVLHIDIGPPVIVSASST